MSQAQVHGQETEERYHKAAREYLRSLGPEDFMEGTPSGTQREITLESLRLVWARRPEVQTFNELLIQYPGASEDEILRIVPDNMVVVHPEPLGEMLSFNYPTQVARPFWVFEYVTSGSERKDYQENFAIYERALRVPYYLIFYPETQDLSLYRLNKRRRYSSVHPAGNGRYPVADLNMEVALVEGWVRFWYAGELLPLPAEMLAALDQACADLAQERKRSADLAAEVARLRALLDR